MSKVMGALAIPLMSFCVPGVVCANDVKRWDPKLLDPSPAPECNGEKWVSGRDYYLAIPTYSKGLMPADSGANSTTKNRPRDPTKIWIRFFFRYTDESHLRADRALENWHKRRGKDVEVIRVPSINWPHVRAYSRLLYALREVGREDLHFKIYDWMMPKREHIYHRIFRFDEAAMRRSNIEFATRNGIDETLFTSVYDSQRVTNWIVADGVALTDSDNHASVIVNGKYVTSLVRVNYDEARMTHLLDDLVACERDRIAKLIAKAKTRGDSKEGTR